MTAMEYALTGAGMIFSSVGFWTLIQCWLERKSASRKAMMGLTYLGIKMSCKAIIDRGYVSVEELEDIEKYLYEPYREMGGNGTAEEIINRVKKLPTSLEE